MSNLSTVPTANPFTALKDYPESKEFYDGVYRRMKLKEFTPLQSKAFETPEFWEEEKSLMVQGATSSGKTLIAEVAMNQCRRQNKKVIYLAPLRLMVSEKYEQFSKDFPDVGYGNKKGDREVVASSRDYQVYDNLITQGSFGVAVIVYEKFYALLAQNDDPNAFLSNCGLIVLDEAQMIGDEDRGMKAIMSLLLANQCNPNIRIICMTTTYSDMTEVSSWFSNSLNWPLFPIQNELNSLPLEEMVVYYDGTFRGRYVPSAKDMEREDREAFLAEQDERLQTSANSDALHMLGGLEPASERWRNPKKKKQDLLHRILRLNAGRKVIIFCHSRRYCAKLADEIAIRSAVIPVSAEMTVKLQNEGSDTAKLMLKSLFPRGVAFHHAALSYSLRSIIEEAFSKDQLNILVATETLAIGVNLPADVIIVYDTKKRNRLGESVDVDEQTYKNYIGRAGRLLLDRPVDENPRSYLLAVDRDELPRYWRKYINASVTRICPVFKKIQAEEAIPYFLSLLSLKTTTNSIQEALKTKLNGVQGIDEFINLLNGDNKVFSEEIRAQWKYSHLVEQVQLIALLAAAQGKKYYLSEFGKRIVPYAFPLYTSYVIRRFLFEAAEDEGGMPASVTAKDLDENKYLLDILYLVSVMPDTRYVYRNEVLKTRNGNDSDSFYTLRSRLLAHAKELLSEHDTWKSSFLRQQLESVEGKEDRDFLMDLYNVVLLYHWTSGDPLQVFQERIYRGTNVTGAPEEGMVERLANIASYQIEAIGNCMEADERRFSLRSAFIKLSSRVNYGCNDECVGVLNCHVPGVSRQSVLNAAAGAREEPDCPNLLHYLLRCNISEYFPQDQIDALREELSRKYSLGRRYGESGDLRALCGNLLRDGKLPAKVMSYFRDWETRERFSMDECISFFQTISEDDNFPFFFSPVDSERNFYTAAYMTFSFGIIFLDGSNDLNYNLYNFNQDYKELLDRAPGRYIVVFAEECRITWKRVSEIYDNCWISVIRSRDLMELYLRTLPLITKGIIHPFLYNLYFGPKGMVTSTVAKEVPERGYWEPEDAPEVFISYVHRSSRDLANRLYQKLTGAGHAVFLDAIGIRVGDDFPGILRNAIRSCKSYVLLFDRFYGTASSPWTKHELNAIITEVRNAGEGKQILPLAANAEGNDIFLTFSDIANLNIIGPAPTEQLVSDVLDKLQSGS